MTTTDQDRPTPEHDLELLQKSVAGLMEHFDTVQIFATRYHGPSKGTRSITHGAGNYYARQGAVREWIVEDDAKTRHDIIDTDE